MTPQELKNSILQLAIQGKLVEQRAEEGTAEELFETIKKYSGVIKKSKTDMSREELIEALEMATIENEYLKKLSALVQKRKAQEQKKK